MVLRYNYVYLSIPRGLYSHSVVHRVLFHPRLPNSRPNQVTLQPCWLEVAETKKPDSGSYTKNLSDYYVTDKDRGGGIHMIVSTFFLRICRLSCQPSTPYSRAEWPKDTQMRTLILTSARQLFRNSRSRIVYSMYIHVFGEYFHWSTMHLVSPFLSRQHHSKNLHKGNTSWAVRLKSIDMNGTVMVVLGQWSGRRWQCYVRTYDRHHL